MAPKSARKPMPSAPHHTATQHTATHHATSTSFSSSTSSATSSVTPSPAASSAASSAAHEASPLADTPPLNYHTNIGFLRGRQLSLLAALSGVGYTIRTQPNAWIEIAALSVVALAGLWFGITWLEWGLLGLTVAMILALESVNTAVEAVVDLVSPHYHPLAKIAKDTAAGALVIAVLGSIFVAACIFGPRLWEMIF